MGWRRITARYDGTCIVCGKRTKKGRKIRYNAGRGVGAQVTHDHCRIAGER